MVQGWGIPTEVFFLLLTYNGHPIFFFFRSPNKARKVTQILAVVAVSVGAFIHGTTVSFPAVTIPSICKSNRTNHNVTEIEPIEEASGTSTITETAYMPFYVTDNDIAFIGMKNDFIKIKILNYKHKSHSVEI